MNTSHKYSWSLIKKQGKFNEERILFSTNGARIITYPYAKMQT